MEINITLYKRHIINDVAAECNLIGRTLETAGNAETANNKFSALTELAGYIKSPSDNETKPIVARAMSEGFASVKEACQRFLIMGRDTDDNRLELLYEDKQQLFSEDAADFFDSANYVDTVTVDGTELDACYLLGKLSLFKGVKYTISVDMRQARPVNQETTGSNLRLILDHTLVGQWPIDTQTLLTFEFTAPRTVEGLLYVAADSQEEVAHTTAVTGSVVPITVKWQDFGMYELDLAIGNFNTGVTSTVTSYAHRLIVDHVMAAILKNQQIEGYQKYIQTEDAARKNLVRVLQARRAFGRNAHDWM